VNHYLFIFIHCISDKRDVKKHEPKIQAIKEGNNEEFVPVEARVIKYFENLKFKKFMANIKLTLV